jgi:signal transduction histidine kinase
MAERERIARDLHDTLLQSTQGLIVRLQAQADRLAKGDPTRVVLEDALDRADETLAESRTRVLDMHASSEVPVNLGEALARVAREQPGANEVEFSTLTEETPRELNPAVADEIYSIAREALRNAFQHSQARHIQLRLTYAERGLGLSIRDDGVGMAADLVEAGKTGHFGLKGMKERAAKIGARLEIISAAPSGTVVTLTVPARVAYGPRGWLARLVDRWRSLPESSVTPGSSVPRAQPSAKEPANV